SNPLEAVSNSPRTGHAEFLKNHGRHGTTRKWPVLFRAFRGSSLLKMKDTFRSVGHHPLQVVALPSGAWRKVRSRAGARERGRRKSTGGCRLQFVRFHAISSSRISPRVAEGLRPIVRSSLDTSGTRRRTSSKSLP